MPVAEPTTITTTLVSPQIDDRALGFRLIDFDIRIFVFREIRKTGLSRRLNPLGFGEHPGGRPAPGPDQAGIASGQNEKAVGGGVSPV